MEGLLSTGPTPSSLFEIKAYLSLLLVQQKTNGVYYQTRAKTAPAMANQASKLIFKKEKNILKFFERYLPYGLQPNMQLSIEQKNHIISMVSIARTI